MTKTEPRDTSSTGSSSSRISLNEKAVESETEVKHELSSVVHEETSPVKRVDAKAEVIKDRGVYRVEALKKVLYSHEKGLQMRIILGVSLLLCAWASSLDTSVTMSLQPWATSAFQQHSMGIGTISIASQIISAISKPVWARTANIISRPTTYLFSMAFYVVGYIIVASSHTISAYIVGSAFSAAGSSGVNFLTLTIVADLTTLKWRALAAGMLNTPFIINTWYAGYIVLDLGPSRWRWGYGIFCIIMPVVLSPAIIIMFVFESRAQKYLEEETVTEYKQGVGFKKNWKKLIWRVLVEVDALGLILLGFAFALLLLPFSLYREAEGQWRNPSMIAMLCVGGVLIILFIIYEVVLAPFPIVPRKCLNKTLIAAVVSSFISLVGGMLPLIYLTSYLLIVKEWSLKDWTYFNNTFTLASSIFGVVAGICMKLTHRHKIYQYFSMLVATIGYGIMIEGNLATTDTAKLVISQILNGMAASFGLAASSVALQASIPHRDLAISMSILSLFSSIGSSVGAAISSAIWQGKMVDALRKNMPPYISDEDVMLFFSNLGALKMFEPSTEIRQGAIMAYREVFFYFYPIALGLQVVNFVAVTLQRNYYLGDSHNAVEDEDGNSIPAEEQIIDKTSTKRKINWKHMLMGIEDWPEEPSRPSGNK